MNGNGHKRLSEDERLRRRLARYSEAIRMVDEGKARPQVVEAVELLREGLNGLEIAKRLGLAKSTVYQRLNDPTDEQNRARKREHYGSCENCGAPTAYNVGGAARFCHDCQGEAYTFWTRETIIEAIREYDRCYGHPPGAMDWNPNQARKKAAPERLAEIEERWEEGLWPVIATVQYHFDSWATAVRAAGFEPPQPGHRIDPIRWRRNLRDAA